jgi:hypothetical protein
MDRDLDALGEVGTHGFQLKIHARFERLQVAAGTCTPKSAGCPPPPG